MNNKPVAWGMLDSEGGIYDTICPEEHDREEGAYSIPLYTHPADLTDEEIWQFIPMRRNDIFVEAEAKDFILFARAILKKASKK